MGEFQHSKGCRYLAWDIEPHQSLTGGTWYNDEQEFDAELVRALCQSVLQYVRERQMASFE
eukprot:gene35052-38261_t